MVAVVPIPDPRRRGGPPSGGGRRRGGARARPATGWGETVTPCPDRAAGARQSSTRRRASPSPATTAAPRHGASPRDKIGSRYRNPADTNLLDPARTLGRRPAGRDQRGAGRRTPGGPGRVLQRQLPALRAQDRARRLRRPGPDHPRAPGRRPGRRHQRQPPGGQRDRRVRRHHGLSAALRRRPDPQRGHLGRRPLHVPRVVRAAGGPTPGARSPTARPSPRARRPSTPTSRLLGRDAAARRRRPGRPAAHDGGGRPQQPRVPAVRDTFVEGLEAAGNDVAVRLDYTLDIATLPTAGGEHHRQGQGRRASPPCRAPATRSCR